MTDRSASEIGLCARCRHARFVPAGRAAYWLCRLAADDARFERYPRLPVLACEGYERGESVQNEAGDGEA
jgi:hypothetical protein